MAIDYETTYPTLRFDRPADGILRITLDGPGLNAVSEDGHRELADVWLTVDRDPDTASRSCAGPARDSPRAAISP